MLVNRIKQYKNTVLLLFITLLTVVGCDSSTNETDVIPPPSEVTEPEVPVVQLSRLHASGSQWLNAQGNEVKLKGVNLGNWLLQEFWMMGQSTAQVNDQCTLENILTERFGYQEKERLIKLFHDNWITAKDWDIIADFGLNTVRVPFLYSLIEDEKQPMTLRDDAWHYLDLAIAEAQARNMYVILDLHGAVGSQGWEHHSGCADENQYWQNESYQERTRWLWQQIADRYKDSDTVAGYGLLNEPWGTTAENLAVEIKALYDAVREIDQDHIIILPGHNSGISAYGDPAEQGMSNVAFEMHFYPGIFGWGEPGYEVHRDWLTCGKDGSQGVCQWQQQIAALNTPFLNGEFQPWANLGDLSGEITRASFDTYADLGWASTAWSYKVFTNTGGQGSGTWGLVTNLGLDFEEKLVSANTWACAVWESDFANACDTKNISFTAQSSRTAYLVVKTGALDNFDISFDNLSLTNEITGNDILTNGQFGDNTAWTEWQVNGTQTIDYADHNSTLIAGQGATLHMTGGAANGGIYQAVALEAGVSYTFSGNFKDNGSVNSWAEIYLVPEEPSAGTDVIGTIVLPQVDFQNDSLTTIEALFTSFGSAEYEINDKVQAAMTAEQGSALFNLPAPPTGLNLTETAQSISLSWQANSETDVTGYNVYRSISPAGTKTLLAENINATSFEDTETFDGNRYYVITALDAEDISYFSDTVAIIHEELTLPGKVQAENYTDMFGIKFENTTDVGGGQNSGFAEPDDFLTYQVEVTTAGTYTLTYRLATETGSTGFQLLIDDILINEQAIPATGGWQTWADISTTLELTAGPHKITLLSIGKEWNLNWLDFTLN